MVNGPRIILSGQGMLKVLLGLEIRGESVWWVSCRQLRPCGGRKDSAHYSGSWARPSHPDRISKGLVKEHAFPQKNVDGPIFCHNHTTTTTRPQTSTLVDGTLNYN